ncbi:RNA-binding protein 48 [Phtheirospermum japonicum]|uniref:RNA-binding protein 48 n=1 Tax=Phtheirospermum japonicum TaxID=374723 RepID=A0A830CFN7_9LAMI|nr:RNA-binding protein 48 [Phtheirospermum japonicum]
MGGAKLELTAAMADFFGRKKKGGVYLANKRVHGPQPISYVPKSRSKHISAHSFPTRSATPNKNLNSSPVQRLLQRYENCGVEVAVWRVEIERYLNVRNIPFLGCGDELLKFSIYGYDQECKPMDAEDCITDAYWIKFHQTINARFTKRKIDESVFLGSRLQVSYAPDYESLSGTKGKLEGRRKEVLARLNHTIKRGSSHRSWRRARAETASATLDLAMNGAAFVDFLGILGEECAGAGEDNASGTAKQERCDDKSLWKEVDRMSKHVVLAWSSMESVGVCVVAGERNEAPGHRDCICGMLEGF